MKQTPSFMWIVLAACMLLVTQITSALIMVEKGNKPTNDRGWPTGVLEVANLKSRIGFWEGPPFGGGEYHFLYRGDAKAANEALAAFAKIKAPVLEVLLEYLFQG
jgi:hypothetical protein